MKYIITESQSHEAALEWMKTNFNPNKLKSFTYPDIPNYIYFIKNGICLMKYDIYEDFLEVDEFIFSTLKSFFGSKYKDILEQEEKKVIHKWLKDTWNLEVGHIMANLSDYVSFDYKFFGWMNKYFNRYTLEKIPYGKYSDTFVFKKDGIIVMVMMVDKKEIVFKWDEVFSFYESENVFLKDKQVLEIYTEEWIGHTFNVEQYFIQLIYGEEWDYFVSEEL